jgi:hypothetical protein
MGLNLALIKNELNKMQAPRGQRGNGRKVWWRPTETGKTYNVRLVAFPENDGKPFVMRRVYKNIMGWRPVIAPFQFDQPDPVQELITTLQERRQGASKPEQEEINKLLKQLYPKEQYYALVLDRDNAEEGLKFWTISQTVVQQLYTYMLDDDYGDITDPETGTDLKIVRTETNGKKSMTITPARKSSKLAKNADEIQSLIENAPLVDDYNKAPSFDELKEIVEAWMNNGGVYNENAESSRFVRTEAANDSTDSDEDTKSVADSLAAIDAAFSA